MVYIILNVECGDTIIFNSRNMVQPYNILLQKSSVNTDCTLLLFVYNRNIVILHCRCAVNNNAETTNIKYTNFMEACILLLVKTRAKIKQRFSNRNCLPCRNTRVHLWFKSDSRCSIFGFLCSILTIVLSDLHQFAASDCSFGIFGLFFLLIS